VVLRRGPADLPRLAASLQRRYGDRAGIDPVHGFNASQESTIGTRRAIRLESGALLAFAVLAGLATLFLVGQTLGRQIMLEAAEYPVLRALGMTRAQLVGVAVARSTVIGVLGAIVAAGAAVALSPLAPIGVARRAELDPGVAANIPVLVAGAAAVVALVMAAAALPAWRAARAPGLGLGVAEPAAADRPSRAASLLASAGLPPAAVTGARLALEPGRGRTAVPVRAAIGGAALAVCALVVAVSLGASLARVGRDPARYGATWDLSVGNYAEPDAAERGARLLAANPAVAAYAGQITGDPSPLIDGRPVPVQAFQPGEGAIGPAVVEGREPVHPDEIALGSVTLRTLAKRIGDTVTVAMLQRSARLRIVGRVMVNSYRPNVAETPGKGAIVHPEVFQRLGPAGQPVYPSAFLVRLDPAVDRGRAVAELERQFPETVGFPLKQPDLRNVERVTYLPGVLAALIGLLAAGTVSHALVSSVRRRRRDLAVLKVLGFARGQVSATVAWQATAFAAVALLVGLPLGVAAGRWAWRLVADQLGLVTGPVVPPLALLAIAVGALAVANLAAAGPGWAAGRIRPAAALYIE
jgi:hypothetical protein